MTQPAAPHRRAARPGFTLVEIMLVVIIIGIIAAFAVPNIARFGEDARMQKAINELKAIENNLDLYELKKGKYPDSLDAIAGYFKSEQVPVDPWGNAYKYSKTSGGYTVTSGGKAGSGTITSSSEIE